MVIVMEMSAQLIHNAPLTHVLTVSASLAHKGITWLVMGLFAI
jgi:hypothetical protein